MKLDVVLFLFLTVCTIFGIWLVPTTPPLTANRIVLTALITLGSAITTINIFRWHARRANR